MTPVGEALRRERLKRNLDFEQISRELKISPRFLQAIENDQYDKLPGGVFAKSFVRQYARLLGLDEEELAGQVQSLMAPVSGTAQAAETGRAISVPPIQVPRVEEWEHVGDRGFRWNGSLSAAAMVVVVMLVCSSVYAWLQRPRSPAATPSAATAGGPATVGAQATPPATGPPPVPAEPTPAPVQLGEQKPAGQTPVDQKAAEPKSVEPTTGETKVVDPKAGEAKAVEPKTVAPNPVATVHVAITAEEPVWMLARTDGKYAFSGTLAAGETRSVEAVKDVVLRLGNAGSVTISLNGKPVGPVGPKGQPRTLQLTSGGFQIVAVKPPSAPFDPLDRL